MNEPLDLDFPVKRVPVLVSKRPLSQTEVDNIGPRNEPPVRVQQFRDSHHRIARAYAFGLRDQEVSIQTGYSLSRLMLLKSDPAFKDLIARYRELGEGEDVQVFDLMRQNHVRTQVIIAESLEATLDRSQPLAPAELRPILDLSADLADRTGLPKHNVNTQVTVHKGDIIEAARKRASLELAKEPVTK